MPKWISNQANQAINYFNSLNSVMSFSNIFKKPLALALQKEKLPTRVSKYYHIIFKKAIVLKKINIKDFARLTKAENRVKLQM